MKSRQAPARGFTLVEIMITIGGLLVVSLAFAEIFRAQYRQVKELERRVTLSAHQGLIRNLLGTSDVCSCQLSAATNVQFASALQIDTVSPGARTIALPVLRGSCDLTSSSNIIAQAGQPLLDSMPDILVAGIEIGKIHPLAAANEYAARLTLNLSSASGTKSYQPITVRLRLGVDPALGTPEARPITGCTSLADVDGMTYCPAGFTLVGAPGTSQAFCIEAQARNPKAFFNAHDTCAGIQPAGFNAAALCRLPQMKEACLAGALGGASQEEMGFGLYPTTGSAPYSMLVDGFDPGTCKRSTSHPETKALRFRCCL